MRILLFLQNLKHQNMEEGNLKKIAAGLAVVAVVLAGVLAYIWVKNSRLVKDLQIDKEELTAQMVALQNDYAELSSDYDTINAQLDSSREEVAQLIERVKKTQAANRAQMRKYEKELGTLRTIMRGYIVQIDSLNTLNKKLTAEAAEARRDAAESKARSEQLSKTVDQLSSQVATGSVIKATGLHCDAYNASGNVTDRSSRVVKLLTSLTLTANDLAPHGPVRVYIIVKDPEGVQLLNSTQKTFSVGSEPKVASASREVDYEGNEVDLSIYLNDIEGYVKGIYTVEAYTAQSFLGSCELMLR